MKIFRNPTRIMIFIMIFLFTVNMAAFGKNYNPSRQEIESMIDEVARKRAIPSVLLKSIAKVESTFTHYNSNGSPKISGPCIGLMMINNKNGGYDSNKLKYDIEYNIEAGADVLLNKWSMSSYKSVSSVGNMDPNILENWYFALWAYNGWAQSNNPHMLPSYAKKYTYQQLIYNICEEEYDKEINNIDISYLPSRGKPSRSLVVPTPSNSHSGDIILYEVGDFIRTDGVRTIYNLRDVPAGNFKHELKQNQLGIIKEGPILKNGYYWYKIYVNDSIEGWIERNWLLRTGDTQNGRYVFDDIAFHWGRKNIMQLYNAGIVSESKNFYPDNNVTKEEFCIFLSKTLKLENEENKLAFKDKNNISQWALNYVSNVYNAGLLNNYTEFKPKDKLTRKEAALIFTNLFEADASFESMDITSIFKDINNLNSLEKEAIKKAYVLGI
ncbi:MAG: S-layer homology domain-containing protein, partial [Tissierellia bacterium]|nr:S-layer homology domain-containing protein [Tissierellia bacterium]